MEVLQQLEQECAAEDRLQAFRRNPVGWVVVLPGGIQREVRGFQDTPKGRWLCCGRRWGPWVPESDVEGLVTFSLALKGRS